MSLLNAIREAAAVDPALTVAFYESMAAADRRDLLDDLISGWGREDPGAAARWLASRDEPAEHGIYHSVASQWARTDATAAIEWAQAVQAVLSIVARRDPQAALAMLERIDDERIAAGASSVVVQHWAATDHQGALAWANRFEDPHIRTMLLSRIITRWAQTDRTAALRHVETLSAASAEREAAAAALIQVFAGDEPETAERLFETIETPALRRNAAGVLAAFLSETDPSRAARYRSLIEPEGCDA